jgi:hypothetical protein
MHLEFSISQFVRSHGRNPKGRGSWAFAVKDLGGEVIFTPSMTFAEAKVWIRNRIRPEVPCDYAGAVVVEVLP